MSVSLVPRPAVAAEVPGGTVSVGRRAVEESGLGIGPLVEAGDATDVVEDGWIAAIVAGDAEYEAALRENMRLVKSALAGPTPSALEEVLIDNLMSMWLQKNFLGNVFTKGLLGDLGAVVQAPGGERMLATWIKLLDVPLSRFNQTLRILLLLREQASSGVGPASIAPSTATGGPVNPDEQRALADQAVIGGQADVTATTQAYDPAALAPPDRPPGDLLPGADTALPPG